jgi:hypothetical protein
MSRDTHQSGHQVILSDVQDLAEILQLFDAAEMFSRNSASKIEWRQGIAGLCTS